MLEVAVHGVRRGPLRRMEVHALGPQAVNVARVRVIQGIGNVAEHPDFGTEIQWATGVNHESPEVLVLRNGAVAWHASHGGIRASVLRPLLGRLA